MSNYDTHSGSREVQDARAEEYREQVFNSKPYYDPIGFSSTNEECANFGQWWDAPATFDPHSNSAGLHNDNDHNCPLCGLEGTPNTVQGRYLPLRRKQ